MLAKNLKIGEKYLYTAGAEPVEVEYLHETMNGFVFSDGRTENVLNFMSFKLFIEEKGSVVIDSNRCKSSNEFNV